MRRTDPKLIINLNISDEEFEKQIELAVDKYVDSILDSCINEKVNEKISKYVDKKLVDFLSEKRYDANSLINGMTLSEYIRIAAKPKVEEIITKGVAECIAEVVANKFTIDLN